MVQHLSLASKVHGTPMTFTEENMPVVAPDVPQQTNGVDCGVYVLLYVDVFCKKVRVGAPGHVIRDVLCCRLALARCSRRPKNSKH